MPLYCICASSSFPSSRQMHFNFTPVGPSFVQSVVDKLIHTSPPGYFFSFFLLFGMFSSLEVMDYVSCPSWSLRLNNKDQRHLLICGSAYLNLKNLYYNGRVLLTRRSGVVPATSLLVASGSSTGRCLAKSSFVGVLDTGVPRLACLRPAAWLHRRSGTAQF